MSKLCYDCRRRPRDERYRRYKVINGTNKVEHIGYACRICAVRALERTKRSIGQG